MTKEIPSAKVPMLRSPSEQLRVRKPELPGGLRIANWEFFGGWILELGVSALPS